MMSIFKKYFQKRKIKDKIYKEYENALENKDYIRTGILSKRFLKIK
jgi:N-glycosylase/DNA lyase